MFVRIQAPGRPSVADMLAPYADEIATHEFEKLEPVGRVTLRPRKVNWKNVGDNYSDALHIPVAHPGLTRLFGATLPRRIARMGGPHVGGHQRQAFAQLGRAHVPEVSAAWPRTWRPDKRRSWVYFKLWPNFAFDVYPDQVDIMQWLPLSPTQMPDPRDRLRAPGRAPRNARRALLQLAHQPAGECRRPVLIERVQDGMASGSYRVGPLAAGEVALRSFGQRLRTLIPECSDPAPPAAGWSRRTAGSS